MFKDLIPQNFIQVPEIFHCEQTKSAFTNCTLCDADFTNTDTRYTIEKAYRQDVQKQTKELVFEIAVCEHCSKNVYDELSEDSKNKIQAHFLEKVDFLERYEKFEEFNLFDTDSWLTNCLTTGKPMDELEEYQIYAFCEGTEMIFFNGPYMLSGIAIDNIMQLMSNKTLDILNGYTKRILGVPPGSEEKISSRKLIFV